MIVVHRFDCILLFLASRLPGSSGLLSERGKASSKRPCRTVVCEKMKKFRPSSTKQNGSGVPKQSFGEGLDQGKVEVITVH